MESMRDVDRVMEREVKKGSTPLKFEHLGFGDYSYNEITSKEKLLQVLSYLLRIGDYEPFAGKTIGNNVYMDMRGKKAVFKRTRLTYERNNIFASIKRLAKKYKPDYEGKVYLETVRCFFTISEEELEKCRYNYKGKDTYAFVMSDRYIMALYTYCLSARKAVALENIEMEALYQEMAKRETLEAKIYKAIDSVEAVLSHNESDIKTWAPNEYELNLTYAYDKVAFSEYLVKLRDEIKQDTIKKMESENHRK